MPNFLGQVCPSRLSSCNIFNIITSKESFYATDARSLARAFYSFDSYELANHSGLLRDIA